MATYPCRITSTKAATSILRHLDALGVIVADHVLVQDGVISVTLHEEEIAALEARGVAVERGLPLVTRAKRDDVGSVGAITDLTTGFVTGYMDAIEVAARITSLAAAFPDLCSVMTLPFTTVGYDGSLASAAGPASVLALRITQNPAERSRPGFLMIGGTHAREWMNPLIALELAEQLLQNFDPASTDPEVAAINRIVTEGDVIIVPVLNPDGLMYSVHDEAGWRKNRAPNAAAPACPGVDLNRNYEVYFGGAGSSSDPCSDAYRGASALSEAETRNVRWLLEEFPNILVAVDAHSFGDKILRPNPSGGSYISSLPVSAADHAIYTALEDALRDAIEAVNGRTYAIGSTSNHAGTSDEYMFFAHRVFAFNTECGASFQPPWANAVPIIAEVVAGLKALALATLDLTTTTPTPLQVVQCIDTTGSMIAFGYDEPARANARRFIDLLSLGDSTGIVTFADPALNPTTTPEEDRAEVVLPLMLLDDPGDAGTARAAVDAIAFGGFTPIGAGLARSAAELAPAASPRAILLVSDGFENRTPTVASILATWPTDLRVFAIALGPAADAALLQQIATQTGGIFQSSPTALDLHQIYNQMRGDMTDEGILLNRIVRPNDAAEQDAEVEPGADRLTVTVSSMEGRAPRVVLIAPSGRAVSSGERGVRITMGEGYAVIEVDRPPPGRWRIRTEKQRSPRVVAAFVKSPLRTEFRLPAKLDPKAEVAVEVRAWFDKKPVEPARVWGRLQPLALAKMPRQITKVPEPRWRQALTRGAVPKLVMQMEEAVKVAAPVPLPGGRGRVPQGFSHIEIEVDGRLPGGFAFRRVAIRTIRA